MSKILTKSNYLIGLQCPKLLWITKNDTARIPEPDKVTESKFNEGDQLGVLATKVFENGIDLADLDFQENLDKTKNALLERKPIFEAGFLVDNLFSRADILLPVGEDEWDIIEVKSSTKIKELNLCDVSFQKYVYKKAGLKIRNCILMHVNNQYVKSGEIEASELFILADISEDVKEYASKIENSIKKMLEIIEGLEPEFSVDDILTTEYDNICLDEFMDSLPEHNVFRIYKMFKKKCVELYKDGYSRITDIPENIKLNDKQKIQRRLAFDGGKHIDKKGIGKFLTNLKYPIYYLDFETINPAIPKFDGMKPYQRIPFQFSLHIQESEGGDLKHVSFLAEGRDDPRKNFLESLKGNLGETGSILVYNQGFEKGVFNECTTALPEFRKWYEENILPRIKDLWDVFKDFSYYNPKQNGSTSIKYVLPVLSNLSYSEMDIKNGALASLEYERVTYTDVQEAEKIKVRDALEKYCELDTLAEVEIVKGLRDAVK
jgi:hypothetical protein